MARKIVIVDDITDQVIPGDSHAMRVTIELLGEDGKPVKGKSVAATYEVGNYTLTNYIGLVKGDFGLGEFIRRMRSVVKIPSGANVVNPSAPATSGDSDDSQDIRKWARENGYEINDRGRVPAEIREAFEKAAADEKAVEENADDTESE